MVFPAHFPGLKIFGVIWAVYAAVWISLEGALAQVVVLGAGSMLLLIIFSWRRFFGGKFVSRAIGLLITTISGLALGAGSGILTLVLMAVKTGLHAHGPEFSQAEVAWLLAQLPLWTAVGFLAGMGGGLVWVGMGARN